MELEISTKIALQYARMVLHMKQTEGPIVCDPNFWTFHDLIQVIPQAHLELILQIHKHLPNAIASGEILASQIERPSA